QGLAGPSVIRKVSLTASLACLSLLVVACGSGASPAANGAGGGDEKGCTIDSVQKKLEGMDQDARTAELKKLADKEDGDFQLYGTVGAMPDVVVPFEKLYGIKVKVLDLDSEELLQRVDTEEAAGRPQASIVAQNGAGLELAGRKGTLAPITTPFSEGLPKDLVYSHWIANELNVYGVLRNTDAVPADEAPTTWKELADPKYDGRIGIPSGSFDLTAEIIPYLMETESLSEDEAIKLWGKVIKGATVYSDEPQLADAVQRGEMDFGINYLYFQDQLEKAGSKNIEWEPAIQPLVARPNGVAIPCGSPRPATGLLMLDWFLSKDGQTSWGTVTGRDVTNPTVDIGPLRGTSYEVRYADLTAFADEGEKWVGVHNELLRAAR
ncbi:MAG: extracellular solute-binding protein, partial [Marmoricola sp.]|nr:extracellular solute-binding protein [Marmoricola sp.]